MKRFYDDEGFEFDRLILLGHAYRNLTDVGEVLITLDAIPNGDRDAWVREFVALADRREAEGDDHLAHHHRVSARMAYLRAATYYATASNMAPEHWEASRACWDAAVPLFDPPVEPIRIPYEGTELEGYFFHAVEPRHDARPRPTVILNNGSDGATSEAWAFGAAAALERGWHAITFDGPGQNAALFRQKLYFRPDWEAVITPVVDYLVQRPEVDADRLALYGISQAGYWVPRAVAFEHRIAAAAADPGVVRVGDSWRAPLPDVMIELLDKPDRKGFDDFMAIGMKDDPARAAMLRWRMAPYGLDSYFDAYKAAEAMHIDADTAAKITCPLLITAPEHEQFWPGQSAELHTMVPSSEVVEFTAAEGADWHCQPAAHALTSERVFNWLESILA